LAGESSEVVAPGDHQISIHTLAANNFYREETARFLISQRAETHTVALGYRRGFKLGPFSRVEFGGQVQFHESDAGLLNGFIDGVEALWSSIAGSESFRNQLQTSAAATLLSGTVVTKDGQPIYRAAGHGAGFGDVSFVAKALLRGGDPSSRDVRMAARIAVNVSGKSAFTQGNFAGIGISVDKKVLGWLAVHGDARGNVHLDRVSAWGLPLRRGSFAFSAGPELKLGTGSVTFQLDGTTTPYLPAGAPAFDADYGAMSVGFGRRFQAGGRGVLGQIYARENMNLPFGIHGNIDPDLAMGIKVTVQ
jgi:hypothetical protein